MCSASSYELVEPPAPRIVVRPTTLGACQVRLQLSTLLLPKTARANFDARKLTSFVDFEQLKIPVAVRPFVARLRRNPSAARSRASSQEAGRRTPLSRTKGWVRRGYAPGGFERLLPLPFSCASPVRSTNVGGCIEGAGCGKCLRPATPRETRCTIGARTGNSWVIREPESVRVRLGPAGETTCYDSPLRRGTRAGRFIVFLAVVLGPSFARKAFARSYRSSA